jgi:hypothetical protein
MKNIPKNIVHSALTICLFPLIVLHNLAAAGGKGHSAHQHGVAKVNVVAEGNNLTIQLEAP